MPITRRICTPFLLVGLLLLGVNGCELPSTPDTKNNNQKPSQSKKESVGEGTKLVKKSLKTQSDSSTSDGNPAKQNQASKSSTKIVKKSFVSGKPDSFATKGFGAGQRNTSLTQAVLEFAAESQENTPTVVMWLVDQTESATKIREQVVSEIKAKLGEESTEMDGPESLIVGFSEKGIEPLTEKPVRDPVEIKQALEGLSSAKPTAKKTFPAIVQAIDQFESLKKSQRKSVMMVLVTDGLDRGETNQDDSGLVEKAVDRLKGLAIPLFVIGYAAPFGRATDLVEGQQPSTVYGPETAFFERVSMELWNGNTDIFRFDSGFGPWPLERICRASGGRFLADRPAQRSMRLISKMQSNWPAVTSKQFRDSALSAYKPFYGSREDYLAEVQSNKAKLALHNAAQFSHCRVLRVQSYEFRQTDEAALSRQINLTQRIPAVIRPGLEKLYSTLKTGEAERDSLSNKRWQASFDLAYGRTLANYVRVIGLNSMLAELKGGKSFTEEGNNSWILEPADEISTGTSNQKMADKARALLEGVIEQHPDTPWAAVATKELESPMGWAWAETKR